MDVCFFRFMVASLISSLAAMVLQFALANPCLIVMDQKDAETDLVIGDIVYNLRASALFILQSIVAYWPPRFFCFCPGCLFRLQRGALQLNHCFLQLMSASPQFTPGSLQLSPGYLHFQFRSLELKPDFLHFIFCFYI